MVPHQDRPPQDLARLGEAGAEVEVRRADCNWHASPRYAVGDVRPRGVTCKVALQEQAPQAHPRVRPDAGQTAGDRAEAVTLATEARPRRNAFAQHVELRVTPPSSRRLLAGGGSRSRAERTSVAKPSIDSDALRGERREGFGRGGARAQSSGRPVVERRGGPALSRRTPWCTDLRQEITGAESS